MKRVDLFLNTVLSIYFRKSEFNQNGNTFLEFQPENCSQPEGFQSEMYQGKVKFQDKHGNLKYSKSLLIKIIPKKCTNQMIEIAFTNEIFAYNRILPFFTELKSDIAKLFPKFYYGTLVTGTSFNGVQIMENLKEDGYVMTKSKVFLDLQHLLLMVKKLGEFHAYSYEMKRKQTNEFFALASNFKETNSLIYREKIYLIPLYEYFLEELRAFEKYGKMASVIHETVKNPQEFSINIFDNPKEPISVVCHGDFLRNNVLFKYDSDDNPIDLKFIDLGNARYCSPITDLGLMLYMNTDQKMRDQHWDELIDTYYNSLKNTFPLNDSIPSKSDIISDFKIVILQPFLLIMFFLPVMLETEEDPDSDWFQKYICPEYEHFKFSEEFIPDYVVAKSFVNFVKNSKSSCVLDVLCDIIDRNFI